jgi:hypothetical protein
MTCPQCGTLVVIPAVEHGVDAATAEDATPAHEEELNALRIRQLASARRAAYRARSYCVVGALVCVVAVVQLAWTAIGMIATTNLRFRAALYAVAAVVAAWGARYFFRKAMAFDREAKQSALPQPTGEPDFSTLSDGSQQWKNLEDVG